MTPTATLLALPTQVAVIPTTTPLPPVTPTLEPSATTPPTEVIATETPAVAATEAVPATPAASSSALTADVPANVRSGPGQAYPVVGGLNKGDTAEVVGRDSSSSWFVIAYAGAEKGQGWISSLVTTFPGEIASLPLVSAPPPPPVTATPRPVANPGPISGSRGISGRLTLCGGKTSYGVGERVCFVEWIQNTTTAPIAYGILGVQATNLAGGGQFQTSWSGELAQGGLLGIDPGCVGPTDRCNGEWEDGVVLYTPGTYRLTLQLCYSDFGACIGSNGDWEVVSAPLIITVG